MMHGGTLMKTEGKVHVLPADNDTQRVIESLIYRVSSSPYPPGIGPRGSGCKFTPEGEALIFPGNTFVCHVDPLSNAHKALAALQTGLKNGPAGDHFTYLPPSSFHMTVFPGVCGDPLGEDGWPEGISKNNDLRSITQIFRDRLERKEAFTAVKVIPTKMSGGFSLTVHGATEDDTAKIWAARKMLEQVTRLFRPKFSDYELHISLCYLKQWMSEETAFAFAKHSDKLFQAFKLASPVIELAEIEYCQFETMYHFEPINGLRLCRPFI